MKAYDYIITVYIWKVIFFYFVIEYKQTLLSSTAATGKTKTTSF